MGLDLIHRKGPSVARDAERDAPVARWLFGVADSSRTRMVLSKGSACLAGGALESTANMREGKEPPGLDVARCRGLAMSGTPV
jgi:hypothetical protein